MIKKVIGEDKSEAFKGTDERRVTIKWKESTLWVETWSGA